MRNIRRASGPGGILYRRVESCDWDAKTEAVFMKVEYINPFIQGVQHLFSTMFDCKASRGDVGLTGGSARPREITALIGLSGLVRGTVALSFPSTTALAMVSRMLGVETQTVDDTVSDGVAELVNIVAGDAKARFPNTQEHPIDLSLPTVVRGSDYSVKYPSDAKWLEVPFTSDLGAFTLQVTFVLDKKYEGKSL